MFDLVSLIEFGGYIGLFLIIFAESGILIGFFLPGDSLLFTAGFLASQDILNIWILIPLLFIAAVLGDAVGYTFGKRMGPKIFTREKSLFFHPSHVEKTRAFFEKHGVKTIVLARFFPAVRTFAPIMAGVGGMKYSTFAKYNVIGALLWSVGLTLGGYLFGNIIPDADKYILPVILTILVVTTIPPAWQYLRGRKGVNR